MQLSADRGDSGLLRRFLAVLLAFAVTGCVLAEDLPAHPPSSGSSASAPTRGNELDELWVGGWISHNILRVDWQTGESLGMFIPTGGGGLIEAHACSFGTDNNLYVAWHGNSTVRRYDGETGAFMDVFVQAGAQGPQFPVGLAFGPDGHLYVGSFGNDRILRYDGVTGEPLGTAANIGAMGLDGPLFIEFFPGPKCKADLNEDGAVSAADLLSLLGAWGSNAGHPADFDVDGAVGASDVLRLLGSWGLCP